MPVCEGRIWGQASFLPFSLLQEGAAAAAEGRLEKSQGCRKNSIHQFSHKCICCLSKVKRSTESWQQNEIWLQVSDLGQHPEQRPIEQRKAAIWRLEISSAKNLSCSRGKNYGSFKKREYRATSTQHRRETQNTHASRLARSLIYLELWSCLIIF